MILDRIKYSKFIFIINIKMINNVKKNIPSLKDKSIDEIYIKLNHDLNKKTGDIKKFLSFLRNDRQFQMYLMIGIFVILAILGILKYLDIFNKWCYYEKNYSFRY